MTAPAAEPLLGRDREAAAVAGLITGLSGGRGRLVVVAGEAGIGKTRLAQELAGQALALGVAVAWGRCVEGEGAPAYWPWRQVTRAQGHDPDEVFAGAVESPEERFRVVDALSALLTGPLVVVLEDVHSADEGTLVLLRHLADTVVGRPLVLLATTREVGPELAEALRGPAADRWDLRPLDRDEVAVLAPEHADEVHRATAGNPLFVRELARAISEGTWDSARPPRSVVDTVAARLERVSPACRAFLQAAAVGGRDLDLAVLTRLLGVDVLALVDEAVSAGFVQDGRFAHALTRDAVALSLTHAMQRDLHARLAQAVAEVHAAALDDHCADLARHAHAAGDAPGTVLWATRAAAEADRRLAFEEAVRLTRLALEHAPGDVTLLHAQARSAYLAGDLDTWVDSVERAAQQARSAGDAAALTESALLLEPVPDPRITALAGSLAEEALPTAARGARARLLALLASVAFYEGDESRTAELSAAALDEARAAADDLALVAALRARWEALPGPAGRLERLLLADEMVDAAIRLGSARNEMWGRLWLVEARVEGGDVRGAADALPALVAVVERVGGPVSAWHRDRASACVAQSQGRYAEAAALSERALARMTRVEAAPARGAWFALQCALACHLGPLEPLVAAARGGWEPPPRFVTMGRLSRSFVLALGGELDAASALFLQAGPPATWSLPVFFRLPGHVLGARAALALERWDDLAAVVELLEPDADEWAVGGGVSCLGPVRLTLGCAYAALDRRAEAEQALAAAVAAADAAGLPTFAAEARLHLADLTGDGPLARQAQDAVRALGMSALVRERPPSPLSAREEEVAALVAEGLTNKQIAERLFLSERTAQNHVQHILTKLGLSNRAQVVAWEMSR